MMNQTLKTQTNTVLFITFWGQLASYSLHAIMILFLTRPIIQHGLNYTEIEAYKFLGVSHAMGYLVPLLGGIIADQLLGIRRSILLGTIIIACAYLFVMLSGMSTGKHHDHYFIMAYALIPMASSLLVGTASAMISHIHSHNASNAKRAMTYYYMSINIGALIGTCIAPELMESNYGPLSVLALVFVGKAIAALNFARKYNCFDNIIWGKDKVNLTGKQWIFFIGYLIAIYFMTLSAYRFIHIANIVITIGCFAGILWFVLKTNQLEFTKRMRQFIAIFLILEAIVFFIVYNQMNSSLILFALKNSDLMLFGIKVRSAHYQLLNPLLIILIGSRLPAIYEKYPKFSIPYQFALGTMLASFALLFIGYCAEQASNGIVNGNFIAITYVLITFAELCVSAIGLSMIGLYCDSKDIGLAMGVWYLASSLSNTISGHIGKYVSLPQHINNPLESIGIYSNYYLKLGGIALGISILMLFAGILIHNFSNKYKLAIS
jgi:POT family proton-dependent oligopeptide transporter